MSLSIPSVANTFGFVALVLYVISLAPSIIRVTLPEFRKNKILLKLSKYRRQVGIAAFVFGLLHGIGISIYYQIDYSDPITYIKYAQGIVSLGIFTALAVTSNDWSVKKLKKNWKKLHRLTYIVMFILVLHIIDKVAFKWTYLTPVALFLILLTTIMFLRRRQMEIQKALERKKKKAEAEKRKAEKQTEAK